MAKVIYVSTQVKLTLPEDLSPLESRDYLVKEASNKDLERVFIAGGIKKDEGAVAILVDSFADQKFLSFYKRMSHGFKRAIERKRKIVEIGPEFYESDNHAEQGMIGGSYINLKMIIDRIEKITF